MHLRWRLAVVTGAGGGLGREVAVRLARAGAGVLVVDASLAAAEAVAAELRERRVSAWALEGDVAMVAARARDLGGADLLVDTLDVPGLLDAFLLDVEHRRGRATEPGAAVVVVRQAPVVVEVCPGDVARVMWVVRSDGDVSPVAARIVALLAAGTGGAVA